MRALPVLLFALAIGWPYTAQAHELRPASLRLSELDDNTWNVHWKVPARAGVNLRLALYLRFEDDVEIVDDPVSGFVGDAHLQRMRIRRAGGLDGTTITIDGLAGTYTDVLVRLERRDGTTLTHRLTPVQPSWTVDADAGYAQIAWTYLVMGIEHILVGIDHLLFVLGLMLIVRGRWRLVKTITAFTVAHSVTLAIATLGYGAAPLAPLNVTIALSILFLGPEIVRSWRGETSVTIRYPWVVAFLFGLLHGFGFASGLSTTGMSQTEIPLALLFFNIGVEVGQVGFVLLTLAVQRSLVALEIRPPGWVKRVPGYVVGSLGAFWTIERGYALFGGSGL